MKRMGRNEILQYSAEESIALLLDDLMLSRGISNDTAYGVWINLIIEWSKLSLIGKLWWGVTGKWKKELTLRLK